MKAVFIYALKDPTTGAIRYIGKTNNLKKRLQFHLINYRFEKNHRAYWIRSLVAKGLRPELEMLAQVPEAEWRQWEIDYIAAFRSLGCNLVNGTVGGDGPPSWIGRKHSPESIAKMQASKLGKKHTLEARANMAASRTGKTHSLKWRAKQSASLTGRKLSPEHCAKVSLVRTGKKLTAETRAKLSIAHKGKKQSSEHVAKRVAAIKLSQTKQQILHAD